MKTSQEGVGVAPVGSIHPFKTTSTFCCDIARPVVRWRPGHKLRRPEQPLLHSTYFGNEIGRFDNLLPDHEELAEIATPVHVLVSEDSLPEFAQAAGRIAARLHVDITRVLGTHFAYLDHPAQLTQPSGHCFEMAAADHPDLPPGITTSNSQDPGHAEATARPRQALGIGSRSELRDALSRLG